MTAYQILASVNGQGGIYADRLGRGMYGHGAPATGWRNQFWRDTPDWARRIFDDLAEWLAYPRFHNGILVGDGSGPTRDPETGIITYPKTMLPIDANGVGGDVTNITNFLNTYLGGPSTSSGPSTAGSTTNVISNWSMQSDNYHNRGFPWPGWRLDRSGWSHFDTILANSINSRGTHLHFQFNGADPDAYDFSSVSIRYDGQLSAPLINTANIIHAEQGGPLQNLWLNGGAVVHPDGSIDAPGLTVSGVAVSLVGHTHTAAAHSSLSGLTTGDDHTQYLNTTRGDARYSLLGHTHSYLTQAAADGLYSALGHDHNGTSPSFTAVTTSSVLHPSGSGSTISVTGTVDATGLKVGGVSVSLSTHVHAHSDLTGLTSGDPHTQYHTDGRGDARYSLLAHTHASSGAGMYGGYKQDTTDGSGEITVAHGMGSTPSSITVTNTSNGSGGTSSGGPAIGGSGVNAVIHDMDSTNFKVRFHNSTDGSTLTSTNLAFYWIGKA